MNSTQKHRIRTRGDLCDLDCPHLIELRNVEGETLEDRLPRHDCALFLAHIRHLNGKLDQPMRSFHCLCVEQRIEQPCDGTVTGDQLRQRMNKAIRAAEPKAAEFLDSLSDQLLEAVDDGAGCLKVKTDRLFIDTSSTGLQYKKPLSRAFMRAVERVARARLYRAQWYDNSERPDLTITWPQNLKEK